MKSSDRSILLGLVILAFGAAFWFMVLAPKRERAAELEDAVATLESEVAAQRQLAAAAEQARDGYGRSYSKLVTLGKAAPESSDTPALLLQLNRLSSKSGTTFRAITASTEGPAAPASAAAETVTDQNASAGQESAGTEAEAPAAPTEAAAATLEPGTPVGPAALEVQPYEITFTGGFFEVADLLAAIDSLVHTNRAKVRVEGRLLTVDAFQMEVGESGGLEVSLQARSYVLPAAEGLTAGATPVAPSPVSATPPAAAPTPTQTSTEVTP